MSGMAPVDQQHHQTEAPNKHTRPRRYVARVLVFVVDDHGHHLSC